MESCEDRVVVVVDLLFVLDCVFCEGVTTERYEDGCTNENPCTEDAVARQSTVAMDFIFDLCTNVFL